MKAQRSTAVDAAVGARIRNLRLRNRLSQTDVGEFQQIQKYENGTNRVSAGRLAQLAKLFGVPVAAFYSEAPAKDTKPTRRMKIATSVADTNVDRLVKGFQALKDKKLKAAILRVAEEMAAGRRSRSVQRR